jgi:hypothetical protein
MEKSLIALRDAGVQEEYENDQRTDHETDRSALSHPCLLKLPANEASLAQTGRMVHGHGMKER